MSKLSLDDFLDVFSAKLVSVGENKIRLNDPIVREGLFRIYSFFSQRLDSERAKKDLDYRYLLVDLRNMFSPSSIGSFDNLEAILGAKQSYLNSRPNPYYNEVYFPTSSGSALELFEEAEPTISELVAASVEQFIPTPIAANSLSNVSR